MFVFRNSPMVLLILILCFSLAYVLYKIIENKLQLKNKLVENNVDQLTGLPNRKQMVQKIDQYLLRNERFAIVFLQLERFKQMNNVFGEPFADRFLKKAAQKLSRNMKENWEIGKLHGSQFCVIVPYFKADDDLILAIKHILMLMDDKFIIDRYKIPSNIRIGISLANKDGMNGEDLINNARIALCKEVNCTKRYRFFNKNMNNSELEAWQIEEGLKNALINDGLVLHYQPQIDISTGELCGVEALVRWSNNHTNSYPPAKFIPIAEKTGLIVDLGKWVLTKACEQIKIWQDQGINGINMSVNVSVLQLLHGDFVNYLDKVIDRFDIQPERLTLELTESTLINDEKVIPMLNEIKARGVKLAIDDFGTGYSSLSYLVDLPVDFLKIDREFINRIIKDNRTSFIVESIINVATAVGVKIVAEGIETRQQYEMLKNWNCHIAQGYLISRPLETNKVVEKFDLIHYKPKKHFLKQVK